MATLAPPNRQHRYFTEYTHSKAIFYTIASVYVLLACIIVMLQPFLTVPCQFVPDNTAPKLENALYVYNPCRFRRYTILLGLTVEECEFGRRLVWAVVLGCFIGWERKQADRPAGIRTMSLVSLGSCLFSICSAFAFLSGPMAWDASRISAAIPSGVGFLGSALIFKHNDNKTNTHEVHGLTTAASVWLSAAVGIACAGGLYFVASLSTAIMLVLLRFGPRTAFPSDEEEDDELGDDHTEIQHAVEEAMKNIQIKKQQSHQHLNHPSYLTLDQSQADETQPMLAPGPHISGSNRSSTNAPSKRKPRPSLL